MNTTETYLTFDNASDIADMWDAFFSAATDDDNRIMFSTPTDDTVPTTVPF